MKWFIPLLLILMACSGGEDKVPAQAAEKKDSVKDEIRTDFRVFYDSFRVEGTFLLFDERENKFIRFNPEMTRELFSPASTFKICNTLIGLETGVLKDSSFVIPWDKIKRSNENWNRDLSLQQAFRVSAVPWYQELARRIGPQRMKQWLDTLQYGNADTSGGIDQFWLKGGLRITAEQQVDFLRKLCHGSLPFSMRTMDIVKDIMLAEKGDDYLIRAKTGWNVSDSLDVGWYVGWVEKDNRIYYFANCIKTRDLENPAFAKARIRITREILSLLGIIPPNIQ